MSMHAGSGNSSISTEQQGSGSRRLAEGFDAKQRGGMKPSRKKKVCASGLSSRLRYAVGMHRAGMLMGVIVGTATIDHGRDSQTSQTSRTSSRRHRTSL